MKQKITVGMLFCLLLLVSISSAHAALTSNLSAYWSFDSGGQDSLGVTNLTNFSGARINATTYKVGNGSTYLNNATSAYWGNSTVNSTWSSNWWVGVSNMTFCAWIKNPTTYAYGGNKGLFGYGRNNANAGARIQTARNDTFLFGNITASSVTLPNAYNEWNYLCVVSRTTGPTEFYMNGTNVANASQLPPTIGQILLLRLGTDTAGTEFWGGNIDEVGVWRRTLSPQEITRLYNNGFGLAYPFTAVEVILYNEVNNSEIDDFCVNTSNGENSCKSGTSNFFLNNVTDIMNFTFYNISNGVYFNTTILNYNTSGIGTLTFNASQGIIQIQASRLFLNTSITGFNGTNGLRTNQTTTTLLVLPANNGTNNIKIDVAGNISKNITCIVSSPLSTINCNATGIYDNAFTIGANYVGVSINDFNITVTNQSLGGTLYQQDTINGSIVFPLLQGYYYTFFMNSTSYVPDIKNLSANASTNLYNFSLLTANFFELRFYNETSEALLAQTVTVQIISDSFAANYTTSTGNITILFLTPEDYTIRYWLDPDIPRDYYVTLTPQSYQNLSLYIIDEDISSFYIATIQDQNLIYQSDATVTLLRYYVSCNCYKTVEMSTTDQNGQAILRVVPNIINYKLLIEKDVYSLVTVPAKLTSSTGTYTLNKVTNYITGDVNVQSLQDSLVFNNATNTVVYTWDDDNNIVSQGCLVISQYLNGDTNTVYSTCSSGATGSLIYTITETNQTKYVANAYVKTTSEFSSDPRASLTIDFIQSFVNWGLAGIFITLLVFLFMVFFNIDSGTEGIVISGAIAILLMGVFGFMAYTWESIIGILIVAGIIMYKSRT